MFPLDAFFLQFVQFQHHHAVIMYCHLLPVHLKRRGEWFPGSGHLTKVESESMQNERYALRELTLLHVTKPCALLLFGWSWKTDTTYHWVELHILTEEGAGGGGVLCATAWSRLSETIMATFSHFIPDAP